MFIRRLQRTARPLHAESAQRRHCCQRLIPEHASRMCVVMLICYDAFLQINKTIDTPIGLLEPSRHARLVCHCSHQLTPHKTSSPLSTACRSLPHSGYLVHERTCSATVADVQSQLHRGTSASRTRTDARSRAHENSRSVHDPPQPHKSNGVCRGALRAPGNT